MGNNNKGLSEKRVEKFKEKMALHLMYVDKIYRDSQNEHWKSVIEGMYVAISIFKAAAREKGK